MTFHDRGRDEGKLRPSLRTGQANFSHPALQSVVSLQRRSADASRAPFRFEHWTAPVTRAANRLRSAIDGLHTCVALHRVESRGQSRCVFPSSCFSLSPPSYLPWLHGHYPASTLLRRLCHLPGAVLRALPAAMNAAPSRLVIPDSCHSNFQPFYLHPPYAPLSPRSLSRRRSGREVAALPSRVGFRLGLR